MRPKVVALPSGDGRPPRNVAAACLVCYIHFVVYVSVWWQISLAPAQLFPAPAQNHKVLDSYTHLGSFMHTIRYTHSNNVVYNLKELIIWRCLNMYLGA